MLTEFLIEYYLWWKALHIIFVICWMAGLLYLPRLFVYHSQVKNNSQTSKIFKIMEYRLLKFIINPAMFLTYILGIVLIVNMHDWLSASWLHIKMFFVLCLSGFHGFLAKQVKDFANDNNNYSTNFFRYINEIPTIIMIIIVFLVIFK